MKSILHIDFNSYFASVEQQANPILRGKPVGVTGGDRMTRTVIGAASVEAKGFGVKTGMTIPDAKRLCPQIILVKGDSDKYLSTTKKFLNIVKSFSPLVEVFSIDEVFLELPFDATRDPPKSRKGLSLLRAINTAKGIKKCIKQQMGEHIKCSIGISYNKLTAKLAGSLQKPDGLVLIADQDEAIQVLDKIELNEICGIGFRIKKRLNNMGVFSFKDLRSMSLKALLASFKSYGQVLYNMARGIDLRPVMPFFEKEEVKSIGHRHTIDHDTSDPEEIKQILLKLAELIARKLRSKKMVGKTVSCWFRLAHLPGVPQAQHHLEGGYRGDGIQTTVVYTQDGLEIFKSAWKIFYQAWNPSAGSGFKVRMIGISISGLRLQNTMTLSLLPEDIKNKSITKAIDKVNNRYGEFTLQRGILLGSRQIKRRPNSFLADFRFKI